MKNLSDNFMYLFDMHTRGLSKNAYTITVDNSKVQSHNVNLDYPTYSTSAFCEAEAIGKMMQSDWAYKHKEITRIDEF